jgi:hypothetical protein
MVAGFPWQVGPQPLGAHDRASAVGVVPVETPVKTRTAATATTEGLFI